MNNVVAFKARGVRAELRAAFEQRLPLRIQRDRLQPGTIHGFVAALSRDFCLVAEVSDSMHFDGCIAIAIADITALEVDPAADFVGKALALRGEELALQPDFRLDDWVSIARAASAIAPIIAVNMVEDEEGEVSYVGRLQSVETGALILREIDPNAQWYPDTGAYELEAIGSIGFGSGYLDALWRVAGSPSDPHCRRVPASDTLH